MKIKKLSSKERNQVVTKGYLTDHLEEVGMVTKDFLVDYLEKQNYVTKDFLDDRLEKFGKDLTTNLMMELGAFVEEQSTR